MDLLLWEQVRFLFGNTSFLIILTLLSVPYSRLLSKYSTYLDTPTNMNYVTIAVTTVLGCLIFATEVFINTLIGAAIALYFAGYFPVFIAHVLTNGRELGTSGYCRLPRKLSVALAAFNAIVVVFQTVILSLPPQSPVTTSTMNWAPLLIGACIFSIIPGWHFYGKARFECDFEGLTTGSQTVDGVEQVLEDQASLALRDSSKLSKQSTVLVT